MIGILAKRVPGKQAKNGHVWKRTLLNEGGGGGLEFADSRSTRGKSVGSSCFTKHQVYH